MNKLYLHAADSKTKYYATRATIGYFGMRKVKHSTTLVRGSLTERRDIRYFVQQAFQYYNMHIKLLYFVLMNTMVQNPLSWTINFKRIRQKYIEIRHLNLICRERREFVIISLNTFIRIMLWATQATHQPYTHTQQLQEDIQEITIIQCYTHVRFDTIQSH